MSEHLLINLIGICIVIFEKYVSEVTVHVWNWVTLVPLDSSGALMECGCHVHTLSIPGACTQVTPHPPPHSKSTFFLSHDLSLVHKNEDPVAHDFIVLGKALFPSLRLWKPAWGASMLEIIHHVFASGSTPFWVFPVICKVVHTLCSSVWSLTRVPVTK